MIRGREGREDHSNAEIKLITLHRADGLVTCYSKKKSSPPCEISNHSALTELEHS